MKKSKRVMLTPAVMQGVRARAWALGSREDNDDWCEDATEVVGAYLDSIGIRATRYYASPGYFGGVVIDDSHAYVVLDDGTIVDPTITQYIEHGSSEQRRIASGFPYVHGVSEIAVVPVDHPFVKKMGYESHTSALGYTRRPTWVQPNKKLDKARRQLTAAAKDGDYESVDLSLMEGFWT